MITAEHARELTINKDYIKFDKLSDLIYQATQKGKRCIKYYSWFHYLNSNVLKMLRNHGYTVMINNHNTEVFKSATINTVLDVWTICW